MKTPQYDICSKPAEVLAVDGNYCEEHADLVIAEKDAADLVVTLASALMSAREIASMLAGRLRYARWQSEK